MHWEPGNRAARMFAPGEAEMGVSLEVFDSGPTPGFRGVVHGRLLGGTLGGSSAGAAEKTAVEMAKAIATGDVELSD